MIEDTKDHEQKQREQIPTISEIPTAYRPLKNLLMVIPLPDIEKIGSIILPNRSTLTMNEGHVVALGPESKSGIEVGDCVVWDENTENKMEIDGVKFLLVADVCCILRIPKADLEKAVLLRKQKKIRDIKS